jgi:hypothetical protein
MRLIIHLVNGETLESRESTEDELSKETIEEVEKFKDFIKEVFSSSDAAQFNMETQTGWVCLPKSSVLYIETR